MAKSPSRPMKQPRGTEAQIKSFVGKFTSEHQALIRATRRWLRKRLPGAHELVYDNYNFRRQRLRCHSVDFGQAATAATQLPGMRGYRHFLKWASAAFMLTALTGCLELNRKSGTRASMPATPGFKSAPGPGAYVGRGDSLHPVGPTRPLGLEMRSEDLIVTVGFDPQRSGPTLIGPILPLVPRRLRPDRPVPGALLMMTVGVITPVGPVTLDRSIARVRLPDGQVLVPLCDPKPGLRTPPCEVRTVPLTGTGRQSTFVTLPLPVDGYRHPSLEIELPAVEVGGRRIILPRITAVHTTKWVLRPPHA